MGSIQNKVDKLNILRFAAFMMIFLLHSKQFLPDGWYLMPRVWVTYTPAWAGTWIFFILAGYGVGAAYHSGRYTLDRASIKEFYLRRLSVTVPIYWSWVAFVSVFIKPDIFSPYPENAIRILKLMLFCYQEEFWSIEFGLGWYMTTLMRLYLITPLLYYILEKIATSTKRIKAAFPIIIGAFFIFRVLMWYHYHVDPPTAWSIEVYKPFYFNLDMYGCGMLLNFCKESEGKRMNIIGIAATIALALLVLTNSYMQMYIDTVRSWNIYMYIFPSCYLILTLIYVYCFDICRQYAFTKLTVKEIKKNPIKAFDLFRKIQYPMYLFHATWMYLMQKAYIRLGLPDGYEYAVLFTISAFIINVLWSIIVVEVWRAVENRWIKRYAD